MAVEDCQWCHNQMTTDFVQWTVFGCGQVFSSILFYGLNFMSITNLLLYAR